MTFVIVLTVDNDTHHVIGPFASMGELFTYAEEHDFDMGSDRENPIMSDSESSADEQA